MEPLPADALWQVIQEARAAMTAYTEAGPAWVQWWMRWMSLILAPSLVFALWHRGARWIAAGLVYGQIFAILLVALAGPSRLWGLAHLLCWPPAALLALPDLRRTALRSAYGGWLRLALATMAVSLVFDALDVIRYLSGNP